jgi:hypothetical protein
MLKCMLYTVPPRWKIEPADVSVERNRHVTLHCQAEGVPTPSVIWKKATGKIKDFFVCEKSKSKCC